MTKNEISNSELGARLDSELANFTGTENHYRHWLGILFTDGVKFLADRAGAYWLIDAIASWQPEIPRAEREFQLWELTVGEDRSATLEVRPDSDQPAIINQRIQYTDFPLRLIKLYVENGVILLPSEH